MIIYFKFFLKSLTSKSGYNITKIKKYKDSDIHFLHIGKCAGTQIDQLSEQVNKISNKGKIIKHGHYVYLKDIRYESKYFFSIRNPLSRFKSGFYSRKRKGYPRIKAEWSLHDSLAFDNFDHANDLAESLFEDGILGERAFAAINSIQHTAQNQSDWFRTVGGFLNLHPPVWIIRQENFEEDFQKFLERSGLGVSFEDIEISQDPVSSHSNDYSDIPELSHKAKRNLERWYSQDFELYRVCERWIKSQG